MQGRFLRAALAACLLSASGWLSAAAPERDAVIDDVLAQIKEQYVFPDRYAAIESNVRRHQAGGEYAAETDERRFAALLTTHLQEVSHDKHMSLKYQQGVRSLRPAAFSSTPAQRDSERRENYGLSKVEILSGNIGYLNVIQFHDDIQLSGSTIAAAMGFLANTDALIIDLRANRGGGEAMQFLASYFVKGRLELMRLRYRGDHIEHAWTQSSVPGKRYLDKPVYILTSNKTFSAGEAFAYALQSLKRATLVGATTRGGGNPNTLLPIRSDYLLSVPIGESISPVTGGSWEGVGVKPDVAVDPALALDSARRQALTVLRERAGDEALKASLGKELAALDKG